MNYDAYIKIITKINIHIIDNATNFGLLSDVVISLYNLYGKIVEEKPLI